MPSAVWMSPQRTTASAAISASWAQNAASCSVVDELEMNVGGPRNTHHVVSPHVVVVEVVDALNSAVQRNVPDLSTGDGDDQPANVRQ